MVVLYNMNWWTWQLAGRWLMQTRTFALPNLIIEARGHDRPIVELVPHFGDAARVAHELDRLIHDQSVRDHQLLAFDRIARAYEGVVYSKAACQRLVKLCLS